MIQTENILLEHLVTEKATIGSSTLNQYAFKVAPGTNQVAVRQAVEARFGVKVEAVQILNVKPRFKADRTRRGRQGRKPGYKKAIVRLKKGDTIDLS
jgi:large subunit ribosomal protein L23